MQKPDSGHPSGDRLQLHLRPAGARRRARLQHQLHQPDARPGRLRSRSRQTALNNGTCAHDRRPRGQDSGQLPAARHSRHLHALLGGDALAAQHHRLRSARCSRRSCRCAPMPPSMQINNEPGVSNFIDTGDTNLVRAMPTVGLEYRYPFINVQSWGTQTIEPIAQVIVRPNEPQIGKLPNEDAQSLIFDDSNLFRSTSSPAGTASKAAAAPMSACNTPRSSIGRLRQRAVRPVLSAVRQNSFAHRRHHQYRPRQRPRHHPLRLRGARLLSAEQHLHVHLALPLRQRRLSPCSGLELEAQRQFRSLELSACSTATMPPSRSSASSTAARACSAPASVKLDANWVLLGARALRPRCRQVRPDPHRRRLYRRLPHLGPELHHQLHLQRQRRRPTTRIMLQLSLRTLGGTVGQPELSAATGGALMRTGDDASDRRLRPTAMDIAMPRTSVKLRSFRRWLAGAAFAAAVAVPAAAFAQVVVVVNGEPITGLRHRAAHQADRSFDPQDARRARK